MCKLKDLEKGATFLWPVTEPGLTPRQYFFVVTGRKEVRRYNGEWIDVVEAYAVRIETGFSTYSRYHFTPDCVVKLYEEERDE